MTATTNQLWHLSHQMLGRTGLALVLLSAPLTATAEDEDQQPIPKVGNCPVGYRTSGHYCIPLDNTDKEVVIKLESCPVGYRTSGNYCIKLD
ncbi:MAG: hypothetical protein VBE63_24645 [Lamprobacter sp.]|uniref:hypothetical protein n=1 Tax=Lamprobacter sp. TaxID=3100796 RepID=UPI002B26182E|nr:hypothetical protein [Lamprobacter sp.]MEA3643103.1 hypothetical protein [Lamprobacter sp.]